MPIECTLYSKADFQGMTYAGPLARRHPLIRAIDDLLDRYPGMSNFLKCLAAFKVVEYCDEYRALLQEARRTSARLTGVALLRQRAVREYERLARLARAQNNFRKLMHNPKFKKLGELQAKTAADAKGLEDDALLEALDDLHRQGHGLHGLKAIHDHWKKDAATRKNYWDYIDDYLQAHPTAKLYQVKYLDENERRSYEVRVAGGRLWRGSGDEAQPFDTVGMAVNSPRPEKIRGWGIFVMGMDRTIYSGSSFAKPDFFGKDDGYEHAGRINFWTSGDIFHHSSFLGGRPVLCAGEWFVMPGGHLVCVTPKSGHYQPPPHLFKLLLKELQGRGVQLDRLAVGWPWPWDNDRRFYNAKKFMAADQVLFKKEPKLSGQGLPPLADMFDPQSDQWPSHFHPTAEQNGETDSKQNADGQPQGQGAFYQPQVQGKGSGSTPQQGAFYQSSSVGQPGRLKASQLAPWGTG